MFSLLTERALMMPDEDIPAKPTHRIIIISQQWAVLARKWEFTMLISVGILKFCRLIRFLSEVEKEDE